MDYSQFAKRMKRYEDANNTYLARKTPVLVRIDGKAFHTFTMGFDKPFDNILVEAMQRTMKYLCDNISGCVLGYTQSDEITLLLIDYLSTNQEPWLGYVKRKVETISASMATMAFNNSFADIITERTTQELMNNDSIEKARKVMDSYSKYIFKSGKAMFDARAWNMPAFEVSNAFIWRQQDCIRNSIQSLAQTNFPYNQLQGKKREKLLEMLKVEKDIDWNNYPDFFKYGSCCIKELMTINKGTNNEIKRKKFVIDKHIPIFTENREYINKRFYDNC